MKWASSKTYHMKVMNTIWHSCTLIWRNTSTKSDTKMENEITTNWLQRKLAEIRIIWDKIEYTTSRNCTAETRVTEIWIINKDWLLFYRDTTIKKTYIAGEKVTITIVLNYV